MMSKIRRFLSLKRFVATAALLSTTLAGAQGTGHHD